MPGHTFVYSPPVNKVRELIQSGELGDVYFITSSRMNLGLYQADGVISDLAPHDLSILGLDVSTTEAPATFGEYRLTYRSGDIVVPRIEAGEPLGLELADFAHAIRTGEEPRSSSALGLEVVRGLEAAHRSMERSGGPIELVDGERPTYGEHVAPSGPGADGPRTRDSVPIAWGASYRGDLRVPSRVSP
jgi:predicted dehydrogenase